MARESKRKRHERRFGRPERLADSVFTKTWRLPIWCEPLLKNEETRNEIIVLRQKLLDDMAKAKIIQADNVCEFLYADNSKEEWEWEQDFPSCIPPFDMTWIEMARPSRITSGSEVKSSAQLPERWGWLMHNEHRSEVAQRMSNPSEREQRLKNMESQLSELHKLIDTKSIEDAKVSSDREAAFARLGSREKTFLGLGARYMAMKEGKDALHGLPEDIEWILGASLILWANGEVFHVASAQLMLTVNGQVKKSPLYALIGGNLLDNETANGLRDSWNSMLFPAALALSFMNCKNVTLESHDPDAALNRERRKHGLRPFVRYHTINIDPMRQVLRTEGGVETNGLKKALHICRGHFASYSEDRPLFGKYTGQFWRPSHVRGSAKEGVVFSDYNVKAPTGS